MRCPQLDGTDRCRLFGHPDRPPVCRSLAPSAEMCGNDRHHAMHWLQELEMATGARQPVPTLADQCPHRPSPP